MWDRTNMFLAAVLLALLIWAAIITDAHAQGGGYCTAYYIKYYSVECRCTITEKRQRCTGWQQPRARTYSRTGDYYRYRRYY